MRTTEREAIDTQILVFADDPASPWNATARAFLASALRGERRLCWSPQIAAEYVRVVSSGVMREPLPAGEAAARARRLWTSRRFLKVFPKRGTIARTLAACEAGGLGGRRIFDLFYAFTLLDNGVHRLLTHNVKDFAGIAGLRAENPFG